MKDFSLPAAWAAHSRCWLAWPTRSETWGEHLDAVREVYSEAANAIARFEPVTFITKPKNVAEVSLVTGNAVGTLSLSHDDFFLNDNGPRFVTDGKGAVAGVAWRWNAWGNRYPDHERDAAVAEGLLEHLKLKRFAAPLVLEGGAIDADGEGTLIASEPVLLNPNRNPNLDRAGAELILGEYLGAKKIVWIAGTLAGDPAGGLIDNVVCFVKPGTVLALSTSDTTDVNHAALQDNIARLKAATDAKGRSSRSDRDRTAAFAPDRGRPQAAALLYQPLSRQRCGHRSRIRGSDGQQSLRDLRQGFSGPRDRPGTGA